MADQQIYMDVPKVMQFSQNFSRLSELLNRVADTLEALMTVLKFTAFIGMVGGAAVERYLAQLKPPIVKLSQQMEEISGDLAASARAYQNGDAVGSTRFH